MDIVKLKSVLDGANIEGKKAFENYVDNNLDSGIRGDVWCIIDKFEGEKLVNSKGVGKILKQCGILQDIYDEFYIMDSSRDSCINAKFAYQKAFSEYLNLHGFLSYSEKSRCNY